MEQSNINIAKLKIKGEVGRSEDSLHAHYLGALLIGKIALHNNAEHFAKHIIDDEKSIDECLSYIQEKMREHHETLLTVGVDTFVKTAIEYFTGVKPLFIDGVAVEEVVEEDDEFMREVMVESSERTLPEEPEPEKFKRNEWYKDEATDEIIHFKVGDVKPDNIKALRRSTKKDYNAWLKVQLPPEQVTAEPSVDPLAAWRV